MWGTGIGQNSLKYPIKMSALILCKLYFDEGFWSLLFKSRSCDSDFMALAPTTQGTSSRAVTAV